MLLLLLLLPKVSLVVWLLHSIGNLLLLLHLLLHARLLVFALVGLGEQVIGLEDADLALVELNEWVEFHFVFAEGHTLLETNAESLSILEILNGANLQIDKHSHDIALADEVLWPHVLEGVLLVRHHLSGYGFTVE